MLLLKLGEEKINEENVESSGADYHKTVQTTNASCSFLHFVVVVVVINARKEGGGVVGDRRTVGWSMLNNFSFAFFLLRYLLTYYDDEWSFIICLLILFC